MSKEEDVRYLVVLRLRLEEARAGEVDTLLLDGFREIRLPELNYSGPESVSLKKSKGTQTYFDCILGSSRRIVNDNL